MRKIPAAGPMVLKALFKKPKQTPAELIKATGRSNSLVYGVLKNLLKKGVVKRDNGRYSLKEIPVVDTAPAPEILLENIGGGWINSTEVHDAITEGQRKHIDRLRSDILAKDAEILKLNIEILDQLAVINYLEKKLGKKDE
jgi:hypothetical protein